MTKSEFLNALSDALRGLPEEERKDILYDYEEHFAAALEAGKTEEEVAGTLGDPRVLAKNFKADYIVKQAEENKSVTNIFRAVFSVVSLGFFNVVFVIPPFFALAGVMIGLLAAAVGVTAAGLINFFAGLFALIIPGLTAGIPHSFFAIFLGLAITSLGLLFLIGVCCLARFLYKGTVWYLKMNLKVITK